MNNCSVIYQRLLQRNATETAPFVSILESNTVLLDQVDTLQNACELAKREIAILRGQLLELLASSNNVTGTTSTSTGTLRLGSNNATSAALKNETRLRERIESLEEELNHKLSLLEDQKHNTEKWFNEATRLDQQHTEQQRTIANLTGEIERYSVAIDRLNYEIRESLSNMHLAEQQYDGLRDSIRILQHDNESLRNEKMKLESRLVTEKSNALTEINGLNDIIRTLRGNNLVASSAKVHGSDVDVLVKNVNRTNSHQQPLNEKLTTNNQSGNAISFSPRIVIAAHTAEGTCLSMDYSGRNVVVTGSIDSTVKVWDTASGSLRATFRGSHGSKITDCDTCANTVVGAGSDKTCRVWNMSTSRMVSQFDRFMKHFSLHILFSNSPFQDSSFGWPSAEDYVRVYFQKRELCYYRICRLFAEGLGYLPQHVSCRIYFSTHIPSELR